MQNRLLRRIVFRSLAVQRASSEYWSNCADRLISSLGAYVRNYGTFFHVVIHFLKRLSCHHTQTFKHSLLFSFITKIHLFKYTENFTSKNWKFSDKKILILFLISAQNIHCGYSLEPPRRGGSNEYPQFMFLSRSKKNNVYPCKPEFYYIKVGFKGVKLL